MKLKPINAFTSPCTNALTVLKSELVTDVVPNRSSICFGDTMMYRGIDGSTLFKSKIFLASLSLLIVKPSVPASVIS